MPSGTAVTSLGRTRRSSRRASHDRPRPYRHPFRIEKLRGGGGSPLLLASGILTEAKDGRVEWRLVDARYRDKPVGLVTGGAKHLKALGFGVAEGVSKHVGRAVVRQLR